MSRLVIIVLGLSIAGALVAEDIAWEFNGADTEGWTLGHSTANLRAADGKMQFDVTGPDPWIFSPVKDLAVTPQTEVVLQMTSRDGDCGQLYWQSVGADGKPLPYGEERVIGFPVMSDGQMHEYHILPSWEGTIRQIRLDPPGEKGQVAVDSIRLRTVDVPTATELRCEFTPKEAEHWVPEGLRVVGVEKDILNAVVDYTGRIGGTLEGLGLIQSNEAGCGLIRPNLQIDAKKSPHVAVRMSVTEGTLGSIRWFSDADPASRASWQDFFLKPDGRFYTYNLDLRMHPTWKGTIRKLELIVNSPPGAQISVDYVRTGQDPEGPPLLGIGYLSTERALCRAGEKAKVRLMVRNDGGTQVSDIRAVIGVPGPDGEYQQITDVPPLMPGQACQVQWTLRMEGSLAALLSGKVLYEGGAYPNSVCRLVAAGPRDDRLAVGNDAIRLAFTRNSYGCGPAFLEVKKGIWWEQCGVLPSLGEVVYRSRQGGTYEKMLFGEGEDGKLKGEFKDADGVVWSVEATFTPAENRPWIKAEYSISANSDRELIAFRGPMLYAGEGAFGGQKDAALFPGLEWLRQGERSSSWLDATPPRSNRWAPDPYKVTVPLMAVLGERKLVGLMWNARDPWDGKNACPTAHFLSPNFHEGQGNHLMSLFVPSIPEWVMENSIFATRPYALKKDQKLKITCHLFAQEADDILQAVKNWFEVYGVPELPPKPRSYEEEIQLCMDYFNSRWDDQENCWRTWTGRKAGPEWLIGIYTSYLDAAADGPSSQRAREILKKVMAAYEKAPARPYAAATTHRCWPVSDLPFRMGRLAESLKVAEQGCLGKGKPGGIEAQRADGSWGFAPTSDLHKLLGEEGEAASGICARAALPILTYARITGNEKFLKSGQKALDCLDKFSIPRAAQVWEVPVHTPDILAAAYVGPCYLEGFKITGRQEYLQKAIRWGYAGLPFVYAWGVEDRPVMPFAGIPVFGCTFYVTDCWIGRPVQWCALDYAASLQELAKYDTSFPWRRIAEGIILSGMRQQAADGEFKGRFPDSWILRTDEPSWHAMLDPQLILENVLLLTDRMRAPETTILRDGSRTVRVTAMGKVRAMSLKDGVLSFDLDNAPYPVSHLLVAGLDGVKEVKANGAPLAQVQDTDAVAEGWETIPDSRLLCLKLKTQTAQTAIQVRTESKTGLKLPW